MCFNPSPERRVPSPNRYMAFAKFCFCKNNKRTIDRCGQDVNTTNEYGNSLLHMAAALGCTDMVQMLVKSAADPNALNKIGDTPVDIAARNGHTETVRVMNHLLKRGLRAAEPASRFCVEVAKK